MCPIRSALAALLAAGIVTLSAPAPAAAEEIEPVSGPLRVGLVLYPGVELLDFAGPGEVFAASGSAFHVFTVSESGEPLLSQGFLRVVPDHSIESSPLPDVLVIPGGDTGVLLGSPAMMAWIDKAARQARVTLTVCTGAFALLEAGLLDGLEATTWHGQIDNLRRRATKTRVHDDARFVDNGRIVTTAGVSAGIDGALHVVAKLLGDERAAATARYMEYDKWRPGEGVVVDNEVNRAFAEAVELREVALRGLDPVALTEGREVAGRRELTAEHGGLTYRFASAETRRRFTADPGRYALQGGGACTVMPAARARPDLFAVYQGRIYGFGSPACRDEFLAAPEELVGRSGS